MNIYVISSKLIRNNAMHIFIIALNISFTANICCYIILSCLLLLYSTPHMLVYTSLKMRSRDWKRSINGALQYSPCLGSESLRLLLIAVITFQSRWKSPSAREKAFVIFSLTQISLKVKQNSSTLVVSFIQFVPRTDMPKSSSQVFETLILTISFISLQGTFWYFRPQHTVLGTSFKF